MGDSAASSNGFSPQEYAALGVGALASLPSLFSGGSDSATSSTLGDLKSLSSALTGGGRALSTQGINSLAPVLKYLSDLAGGGAATMAATAPERRRVLDQYDTAKRSLSEFGPRGGGTAGAMTALEAQKASDLAVLPQQARKDATAQLGALSTALINEGGNRESTGANALAQVLSGQMNQSALRSQSAGQMGQSIGQLLGLLILAG